MPLIQITSPAELPISVDAVKSAARLDDDGFNGQIEALIKAYTLQAENITGRALVARDFELRLTQFVGTSILLGLPDISAVASVKYFDNEGVEQTLPDTSYVLTSGIFAALHPAFGLSWPATRAVPEGIRIRFTAGFGPTAADVPENIGLWIKANCVRALESPSHLLDRGQIATSLDSLLDAYRTYGGV